MRSVHQCKSSAATCQRLTFHPAAWRRHGASGPHFILGFTRPAGASHSCQRLGVKRTWRRVSAVLVHTAKSPRIVGAPMAPPYHAGTPRIRQPQPRIRQVRCANSLAQVGRCCGRIKRKTAVLAPAPSVNLHVSERATRSTAARRLTLRSRGRAPAGRLWPSFHSWPNPPCLRTPLNSNVSAQKRPQFKRSSPPCKVGESMLNTRSSSQASSVRKPP